MNRRAFHKLLTTAGIGNGLSPAFGQETVTNLHGNLDHPAALPVTEPAPKEPLAIGTRKQLFVDAYIVAQADEVLFTLVPPRKYPGNPVLIPEVPSDGQMLYPGGVRWDEQKQLFRLWYTTVHLETGRETQIPAYAESEDGLHWRRPNLGVREFNGSRANNLLGGCAGMMIYDAHDANLNRRYKAIDDDDGVVIWFSPDGIHWTPSAKNPVLSPSGDTHSLLGWDDRTKKYIGYFRPAGHPWKTAVHEDLRQVGISFSDDAETWTPIVPILVADTHDPPGTEFYWLLATRYEDLYLGIIPVLHLDADRVDLHQVDPAGQEQVVDTQLVCSRDGIRWNRLGNRAPWLPLGPYQSWDDQVIWPAVPTLVGDEIRIYYGGNSVRHTVPELKEMGTGKKIEGRTQIGCIGLATLRRDGWVAVRPNLRRRATLTTRSFILEGSALELNADASKGKILVELLGADSQPLPGFSGAEAASVGVNSVRHQVRWGRALAELRGKPLRLRFTLEDAELYAFQFTA